ncbi:ATP-grasp fold amidoligase family protein [Halosimplex pelagicum]|uniref:Glycosyl transferase n=1 Tax=Halosimplex pelagicum TaxID=869886 RepID=A0A7D5P7S5_9EURY|nr:ATP-grasp fold amidoligase family protein [Halosimplex pelagicum]QLH81341.1 hypothetical protein HZS54_06745 [Halosimplex pelagicum]
MNILQRGVRIIRQRGIGELLRRIIFQVIRVLLLRNRIITPYFKYVFGNEFHLKALSYLALGYWPDIQNLRTFNEKILYRQLYSKNDLFSTVECKYESREYIADRVGESILPNLYHVTEDPNTIPFDSLPDEYVVKPTHLAGAVAIVDEDESPDRDAIKDDCRRWLSEEFGAVSEQYWYQEIEPRIMVEERLRDAEYDPPLDYKFYVFNGRVEYVHVDFDRGSDPTRRFFDRDWTPQTFTKGRVPLGPAIDEPERFDEMMEVAEKLGEEFDFIRVDLYLLNGDRIVFGELTVGPANGTSPFSPRHYDYEFGELWEQRQNHK